MVGLGFYFIALFGVMFWLSAQRQLEALARCCCVSACGRCRCPGSPPSLAGIVAEYGRQPWAIDGVLPTFLSASTHARSATSWLSLAGFVVFYSALAVVELLPDGAHHPAGPGRRGLSRAAVAACSPAA